MKVIIAGTRTITDRSMVEQAIRDSNFLITEVVCGSAPGVDTIGFDWAWENGIPVKSFPADWRKHGKAAGPIRNKAMSEYADALILVWDGKSRGSENMLLHAQQRGLPVFIKTVKS